MYHINRLVGVEMECSESSYNENMPKGKYWHKGTDGSVVTYGREFRFRKPMRGNDAVKAVSNLCDYLQSDTIRTDGVRAGFHLHLNFKENAYEQAVNFLLVALDIAPFIFRLVHPTRVNNSYCCDYDNYQKRDLAEIACRHYRWRNNARYHLTCQSKWLWMSALNLSYYGSIECRLHEATKSYHKIMTWIEFWSTLANLTDSFKIKPNKDMSSKDYYKSVLDRMTISDKTLERFSSCLS